jgi:antitoxin HicB
MMSNHNNKDQAYYKTLPYTVILRLDEDGDYIARIDEFPGCIAHGKTQQEALENVNEVKELWIADCLERNDPIPEPVSEQGLPSGKWVQRVPRSLHRKLVDLAKREKVSLNQLVTSVLAEAVGVRQHGPQITAVKKYEQARLIWHGYDLDSPEEGVTGALVYTNPPWRILRESGTGRVLASHRRAITGKIPDQIKTKLGTELKEYAQKKTTQHQHE